MNRKSVVGTSIDGLDISSHDDQHHYNAQLQVCNDKRANSLSTLEYPDLVEGNSDPHGWNGVIPGLESSVDIIEQYR